MRNGLQRIYSCDEVFDVVRNYLFNSMEVPGIIPGISLVKVDKEWCNTQPWYNDPSQTAFYMSRPEYMARFLVLHEDDITGYDVPICLNNIEDTAYKWTDNTKIAEDWTISKTCSTSSLDLINWVLNLEDDIEQGKLLLV